MTITYMVGEKIITKKEFVSMIRDKYIQDPPEGYTAREIKTMGDEDILDMDYFLNE